MKYVYRTYSVICQLIILTVVFLAIFYLSGVNFAPGGDIWVISSVGLSSLVNGAIGYLATRYKFW